MAKDKDKSNLHVVSLHTSKPLTALEKDFEEFKASFDTILEFYKYEAKITRTRYLALVEEGFTEEEAMELCR